MLSKSIFNKTKKTEKRNYLSGKEIRAIAKENAKVMKKLEAYKYRKADESEYLTKMKNDDNILEIDNLHTYFFTEQGVVKAVNGVSFDTPKNATVGVVGESGCGKTTVGRTMLHLYKPTAGSVTYNGKEIRTKADVLEFRKKATMVFQDPYSSLNPRMTVEDIIAEPLDVHRMYSAKAERREKVLDLMQKVGLNSEHAARYAHEFSGGQRQRIGVARSIIMNPELIIADEPVSALDVSIQAQVINLLNELREKFGLTILFIAHDLSVVKYFSDRIGVMYFGKMVELADADELFKNPLHPYTKSLLSAIPLPDPVYEKSRKRIVYNPLADHDYTVDKPSFREVAPGHFVMCNDAEFEKYQAALK